LGERTTVEGSGAKQARAGSPNANELAYKSVPYPSNQQSPVPQRRLHPNLQTSSGDSPGLIRCVVLEIW